MQESFARLIYENGGLLKERKQQPQRGGRKGGNGQMSLGGKRGNLEKSKEI